MGNKNGVEIWDVKKAKRVYKFKGHKHKVYGVAFSSNGKLVACGSLDATVSLWDVEKGKVKEIFQGERGTMKKGDKYERFKYNNVGMHSVTFVEDDTILIGGAYFTEKLYFWNIKNFKLTNKINTDNLIGPIVYDKKRKIIIMGGCPLYKNKRKVLSKNNPIDIMSLKDLKIIKRVIIPYIKDSIYKIKRMNVSEKRKIIIISMSDGKVELYNYPSFKYLKYFRCPNWRNVLGVSISNDGKYFYTCSGGLILKWKIPKT